MTDFSETPDVPSPCLRRCALGADNLTCVACGRTRHEIAGWARMDNAAKRAVIDRIAAKRSQGDGPTPDRAF